MSRRSFDSQSTLDDLNLTLPGDAFSPSPDERSSYL